MFAIKNHSRKSPKFVYIPISEIMPSLYQPRHYYETTRLDELSRSIRRYGLLQPVLVRKIGRKYEVVAGERRIRAANIAGLTKVPAILMDISDSDAATCAIIENIQRENLTFLDESDAYSKISAAEGYNISSLAYAMCKDDKLIEEKIRFKRFSPAVRKTISYYKISEENAKHILRLGSEETRMKVLKKVAENRYDPGQTSELVEKILVGEIPVIHSNKKYSSTDLRPFRNTLKQTVDIMKRSGVRATASEHESEDWYEYTIKVNKKNT